jgi:hypothetical protein
MKETCSATSLHSPSCRCSVNLPRGALLPLYRIKDTGRDSSRPIDLFLDFHRELLVVLVIVAPVTCPSISTLL